MLFERLINATRLLMIVSLISVSSAYGAEASGGEQKNQLSAENLNELIATLESETARENLLQDLRMLSEVMDNKREDDFSLSEALHLDGASSEVVSGYMSSLEKIGISQSLLGELVIVLVSVVTLTLLIFLNNRLAKKIDSKLSPVRERFSLDGRRFSTIFKVQMVIGYIIAGCLFLYTVASVFSIWPDNLRRAVDLEAVIENCITMALILVLAALAWEICNAIIEYFAARSRRLSESRASTVLPVIRNILFSIIAIIFLLVALSELGVDIIPLLAGAGVAGVALGFGAQALVKDFLTGFIVVIEDLFQVGDVVMVGGRRGMVERITLRKVQLRDLDGTVHTVPFSEVDVVDNYTKEYSYYLMDIGIAYRENVDEVIECLKAIDEEMRDEQDFSDLILEPLEVMGVDKFADSAVIVRARTKTSPRDQWKVGREFNRRIKMRFDEQGIEIPFPHQTVYFGEDKAGEAPSARVSIADRSGADRSSEAGGEGDDPSSDAKVANAE